MIAQDTGLEGGEPLMVLVEQYVTARLRGLTRETPPPQSHRDVDAARQRVLDRWVQARQVIVAYGAMSPGAMQMLDNLIGADQL